MAGAHVAFCSATGEASPFDDRAFLVHAIQLRCFWRRLRGLRLAGRHDVGGRRCHPQRSVFAFDLVFVADQLTPPDEMPHLSCAESVQERIRCSCRC